MAAAKTGSTKKNSKLKVRVLSVDGEQKRIFPCWYHGSREGHGNYMTGFYDNNITVMDKVGKPMPFKQIGELVND